MRRIPGPTPRFAPFVSNLGVGAHSDAQGLGRSAVSIRILPSISVRVVRPPAWVAAISRESDADSGMMGFEFDATIPALCAVRTLGLGNSPAGLLRVGNKGVLDSLMGL